VVPPFSYSNECASVLLTAYIPVFLLGYAIQLILPLVMLVILVHIPHKSVSPAIYAMIHGIIWPQYWLQGGEALTRNKAAVERKPNDLLKLHAILCNDVLNNWLVMMTFGMCSPLVAVAVACAVSLKMSMWMLLIGRFTRHALLNSSGSGEGVSEGVSEGGGDVNRPDDIMYIEKRATVAPRQHLGEVVSFALGALAGAHIPLSRVLGRTFWRLAWCSALFVGMIGWDIAADEVGWLQSLWVLVLPVACVLLLRGMAYQCYDRSGDSAVQHQVRHEEQAWCEGRDAAGRVSLSPLHVEGRHNSGI